MNRQTEHETYWALKLLTLLEEMSANNTNAVLPLFSGDEHFESDRRYPETGLLFAGKQWRAFYHRHQDSPMCSEEHGHFHLFTDTGSQSWAHVVGLSIDKHGLPLQWFMVNRWVTDGSWLRREHFYQQLRHIPANDDTCFTGRWLGIMLQLYRANLSGLLVKRDHRLKSRLPNTGWRDALDNRNLYTLASLDVNLQQTLEGYLLPDTAHRAPSDNKQNSSTGSLA